MPRAAPFRLSGIFRGCPLLVLSAPAAAGVALAEFHPLPWTLAAAFCLPLLYAAIRLAPPPSFTALFPGTMAAFFAYGGARLHTLPPGHVEHLTLAPGATHVVELLVGDEPLPHGDPATLQFPALLRARRVRDQWIPLEGRVLCRFANFAGEPPRYGDVVRVAAFLQLPPAPANPGAMDLRAYYRQRGWSARADLDPAGLQTVRRNAGSPLLAAAISLRRHMQRLLSAGLESNPRASGLLAAMLFGYRHGIAEEIEEQFRVTGTLHLFAVSGQNIGTLAIVFLALFKTAGLRPWRWGLWLIPPLLVFTLAAGAQASAARAFLMTSLLMAGMRLLRPVNVFNQLGAAALLLLVWDPRQLFDVGFQLSFLVVLGLLLLTSPAQRALYSLGRPDPFIPRTRLTPLRRWLDHRWRGVSLLLAASGAAWIASLPLTLYYFGLFSPVALAANTLIAPLAAGVLLCSIGTVLLGTLHSGLAVLGNQFSAALITLILAVVDFLAPLPGGHAYIDRLSGPPTGVVRITALAERAHIPLLIEDAGEAWLIGPGNLSAWQHTVDPAHRVAGINRWRGILLAEPRARHMAAAPWIDSLHITDCWIQGVWDFPSPAWRAWQRSPALHPRLTVPPERTLPLPSGARLVVGAPAAGGLTVRLEHGTRQIWFLAGASSEVFQTPLPPGSPRPEAVFLGLSARGHRPTPGWLLSWAPRRLILPAQGFFPNREWDAPLQQAAEAARCTVLSLEETGAIRLDLSGDNVNVRTFYSEPWHPWARN